MFIVIVEDNILTATVVKKRLELNGYTDVKHFDNGMDCLLQVYEDRTPDVVIMDYHLGLVNGVEILQKIRAYKPDLRVILMSGAEDINVAVQSIKKGAREYIRKDEDLHYTKLLAVLREIEEEISKEKENKPIKKIIGKVKDFLTDND